MNQRPTSITIISWLFIVLGGLNFLTGTLGLMNPQAREIMAESPMPFPVQVVMMYLGFSIMIACGVMMLKGLNSGRWLYIVWSAIGLVISLVTLPTKLMLIPALVVFVVVVFFLLRSAASEYFTGKVIADA